MDSYGIGIILEPLPFDDFYVSIIDTRIKIEV